MKILPLLIVCALVFLLCFAVDKLLGRLFPKTEVEKNGNVVRPARRSVIIGILLLFTALCTAVFALPKHDDTILLLGTIFAALFGILLLINYFSVQIWFDEEKFLYKPLRGKKKEYRYGQICGQRSLMTRGGINITLFVADDTLNLYSSMQNLAPFLSKAFYRWCEEKNIQPDTVENNPRLFTWFPDPDDTTTGK